MSSERLQRWALTAEIIGGIAIVISLIFVGLQVRQSTKEAALNRSALEIAAYQSLMQSFNGINEPISSDPAFAMLYEKAAAWETLSDLEKTRMGAFIAANFRHGDMAFYQYKKGAIEEEKLLSILTPVMVRFNTHPNFKDAWDMVKNRAFTKDYVEYLDEQILEWEHYWETLNEAQSTP